MPVASWSSANSRAWRSASASARVANHRFRGELVAAPLERITGLGGADQPAIATSSSLLLQAIATRSMNDEQRFAAAAEVFDDDGPAMDLEPPSFRRGLVDKDDHGSPIRRRAETCCKADSPDCNTHTTCRKPLRMQSRRRVFRPLRAARRNGTYARVGETDPPRPPIGLGIGRGGRVNDCRRPILLLTSGGGHSDRRSGEKSRAENFGRRPRRNT